MKLRPASIVLLAGGLVPVSARAQAALEPPVALAERVRALDLQLAPLGARSQIANAGFLVEHATATSDFTVTTAPCVTFVAFGSGSFRDLDAHLFDADGSTLGVDDEPDARPVVQACAAAGTRLHHVLEAYAGDGAYVVVAIASPGPDSLDGVARALGVSARALRRGPADTATGERDAHERALRSHGFVLERTETLDAPMPSIVTLDGRADRCHAVVAIGTGTGSAAIDVLDANDRVVVTNRSTGASAVQFCGGNEPLRIRIETAGAVRTQIELWSVDATTIGGETGLWLGTRDPWIGSGLLGSHDEQDAVDALRRAGVAVDRETETQRVASGETVSRGETAERVADGCDVSLRGLLGGTGRLDVRDELSSRPVGARGGPWSVVLGCGPSSRTLSLRNEGVDGSIVQIHGVLAHVPPWLEHASNALRETALAQHFATRIAAPPASEVHAIVSVVAGHPWQSDFQLPASVCVHWALALEDATQRAQLVVREVSAGHPLPRTLVDRVATGALETTWCATAATSLRLTIATDSRAGRATSAVLSTYTRPSNR